MTPSNCHPMILTINVDQWLVLRATLNKMFSVMLRLRPAYLQVKNHCTDDNYVAVWRAIHGTQKARTQFLDTWCILNGQEKRLVKKTCLSELSPHLICVWEAANSWHIWCNFNTYSPSKVKLALQCFSLKACMWVLFSGFSWSETYMWLVCG